MAPAKLKICYMIESTELCGGVRVVLDQARALTARGHDVSILALRGDHRWYPYAAKVQYVADLSESCKELGPQVVIATFWSTIDAAVRSAAPLAVHLCQGFEWALPEYGGFRDSIEAAYRVPIPKLTVGEWLSEKIRRRFGDDAFPVETVGQVVDSALFRGPGLLRSLVKALKKGVGRVLVVGIYESSVKGIPFALKAVDLLRREAFPIHLIRVSTFPLSASERSLTRIDQYEQNVLPAKMGELYCQADVLLAPSRSAEGFGLPLAEALACGLPAVASAIPSHLSLDAKADYALFCPEGDSAAMAAALKRLLTERWLRWRLSRRGRQVMRQGYGADEVAARLEAAFLGWLKIA